jgi:hypothetical protein
MRVQLAAANSALTSDSNNNILELYHIENIVITQTRLVRQNKKEGYNDQRIL